MRPYRAITIAVVGVVLLVVSLELWTYQKARTAGALFGIVPGGQWALVIPPLHEDTADETKSFVNASAPRAEWLVLTATPNYGFPDPSACSRFAVMYRKLLHKADELCLKGDLPSCTVAKRIVKPVSDDSRCEQSDGGPNFRIKVVPRGVSGD